MEHPFDGAGTPIEPSADIRLYASTLRQMFIALMAEGFTEPQTLEIIANILKSAAG